MRILFSEHAKERMRERGLRAADVRLAISHPDRVAVDRTNRHRLMAKRIYRTADSERRLLMVVYESKRENIEVVTVISTSKIRKYL